MEIDLTKQMSPQLELSDKPSLAETKTLIPLIWRLSEALLSRDLEIKKYALQELDNLDAIQISPIIAAILLNLLLDTDETIRAMAVNITANFMKSASPVNDKSDDCARSYLSHELLRMRTRSIFALIQLYNSEFNINDQIVNLIEHCPNAGRHLSDIFLSRKFPLTNRQSAIEIIGIIGYINAIPDLERLVSRLLTRIHEQKAMPFITSQGLDETPLIPNLESTLSNLKAL